MSAWPAYTPAVPHKVLMRTKTDVKRTVAKTFARCCRGHFPVVFVEQQRDTARNSTVICLQVVVHSEKGTCERLLHYDQSL
eukprot:m.257679 g.257679  ORF g.257679 m.257679 type:complete len:81 (-) comp19638_c0_seq7:334-576(-)